MSYEELINIEQNAPQLPFLSILQPSSNTYQVTGAVPCGIPIIDIHPDKKKKFEVTKKDTLIFHYSLLNDDYIKKVQITNLYETPLAEAFFSSINRAIIIPINQLPEIEESMYVIEIYTRDDTKKIPIQIVTPDSRNRKILNQILQQDELVYQVFATLWALEQDLYIDGYKLFNNVNDLSTYKGFEDHYQFIKKYYLGN